MTYTARVPCDNCQALTEPLGSIGRPLQFYCATCLKLDIDLNSRWKTFTTCGKALAPQVS